jgi:hypothetical protein
MTRRPRSPVANLLFALVLAAAAGPLCAAAPDPAKIVSAADLAAVLGGTWSTSSPEPGVLLCEETGRGYRIVNIYLHPANGKSVAELVPAYRDGGETIDEVADLGDAAMYRPQYGEATVEKTSASGETLWLSISVHNVEDPAERKQRAVELARRVAAKL